MQPTPIVFTSSKRLLKCTALASKVRTIEDQGSSGIIENSVFSVGNGYGGRVINRENSSVGSRGGTLGFIKGLVEGRISRVAARVHRWGTGGVRSPSVERECPNVEGTARLTPPHLKHSSQTPGNVVVATTTTTNTSTKTTTKTTTTTSKNCRLMGADLTKLSRVSR